MAPIKFEEHIKEKLENRTLKPSADAWGKLSDRLDNQQKNSNKKPYWFIGLAASVVGILFVVSQFLNNETKIENNPQVVENPEVILQDSNVKLSDKEINEEGIKLVEEVTEINKQENSIKLQTEAITEYKNLDETVAVTPKNEVKKEEKDLIYDKPINALKQNLSFEDQKINDVVAQVQSMRNDNKIVTDADIDLLLEQAQKEIRLNKLINETTGLVDADALLQDVEADLDQSFRGKVLEAIKSSYNSVRTAVAQRNN